MNKLITLMLGAVLALWFYGADSYAAEKQYWKIGHVRPEGTAVDKDARWLVEKITQDSGGRISFEVYPASKLGDYSVVQERCSLGEVEMYIGPFGTTVDKRLALPFTPYLVNNWTEAKNVFASNSVMMKTMGELLEKQNIKILGGWPVYFGGIVLTREPPSPRDPEVSKKMIIRIPPIRSFELTAKELGYTPYPITWVYAKIGLKTGMVEGMVGGGAEGYLGLKDLAKYYLAVKDHFEHWFIYMNLDLWKGLSIEEKVIIQNAVSKIEARRFEVAEADEQANIKRLSDQGTKVINFAEEDLAKVREKVRQNVWPTLSKELGKPFDEVVSSIQRYPRKKGGAGTD